MRDIEVLNICGNGKSSICTKHLKGESVTLYVQGVFGGAVFDFKARAGVIECPIYDGASLSEGELDNRGIPARRIVINGRMESLVIQTTGATSDTNIQMSVM